MYDHAYAVLLQRLILTDSKLK